MDPVTAACTMVTAFINLAAARFAAATPAQQAVLTTIDTQIIQDMFGLVLKVKEDLGGGVDKLKGLFGHDHTLGPAGSPVIAPAKAP